MTSQTASQGDTYPAGLTHAEFEAVSEAVHNGWMETKLSQGVTSRLSETGEEMVAAYAVLSEPCKDLDRGTVRSVLAAADGLGYELVKREVSA
jgi:hypothetical protein